MHLFLENLKAQKRGDTSTTFFRERERGYSYVKKRIPIYSLDYPKNPKPDTHARDTVPGIPFSTFVMRKLGRKIPFIHLPHPSRLSINQSIIIAQKKTQKKIPSAVRDSQNRALVPHTPRYIAPSQLFPRDPLHATIL